MTAVSSINEDRSNFLVILVLGTRIHELSARSYCQAESGGEKLVDGRAKHDHDE